MSQISFKSAPANQRVRDFVLLAPPRSGSNMLASAMNSHTGLTCFGDYFASENFPWLGGDVTEHVLHGELMHHMHHMRSGLVAAPKLVVLTREAEDIVRSRKALFNRKFAHLLPPEHKPIYPFEGKISGTRGWHDSTIEAVEKEMADMRNYAEPRNALFVSYELLANPGGDALGEHEVHRICDYLGVEHQPMTPITKKLPRVAVQ